jgi:hypothetical protein
MKPSLVFLLAFVFTLSLVVASDLEERTNKKTWRLGQKCCPGCAYISAKCCCAPAVTKTITIAGSTATFTDFTTETEIATEVTSDAEVTETNFVTETTVVSVDTTIATTIFSTSVSTEISVSVSTLMVTSTANPPPPPRARAVVPAHLCPVCPSGSNPLAALMRKTNAKGNSFCCPKKRQTVTVTRRRSPVTVTETQAVTETETTTETIAGSTIVESVTEVETVTSVETVASTSTSVIATTTTSVSVTTCTENYVEVSALGIQVDTSDFSPSGNDQLTKAECMAKPYPAVIWFVAPTLRKRDVFASCSWGTGTFKFGQAGLDPDVGSTFKTSTCISN